jgi:hypothetical protein
VREKYCSIRLLADLFGCADKPAEKHCWLICYERKILFRLKNKLKKTDYKPSEQGQRVICVCASGIRMVCKNTSGLYWFRPKNALRPVGDGSLVLSYTDVLVVWIKRVRVGGTPRSQDVSGACVFASDESNSLWICLLSSLKWSLPSPFIDARETPGYMHVLRDIFPMKEDLRPSLLPCSW